MAPQNPTIIVGHLDDSELTKSIDKLVAEVAKKTSGMAENFTQAIDKMKFAMKDFAITQKVSVDLMKEAWRDMSKSFDAMVAAQSGATGGGKGSGKAHAPNTIGALEQEIAEIKQERKELQLNSNELRIQNALLERRKNLYKQQTTSPATRNFNAVMGMQPKSLEDSERQLKLLEFLQRKYAKTTELSVAQQNRLARAIQKTKEQIDKLKPKSLDDVLGMDAKSIDQIAAKMRALKMVQIDPNNTREVNRLGKAYADLKRQQAKMLGQNIQLTHSNNYLAQSFGYIRNRIVYALTLGAVTNFIKQLYEIRGQYELLERSLGVLVGSFEKGTQIFNELNEMAIKSPFTLIELGTAAKQLTAYNFAANEVVDTTRRLADISAALGVPMERLTYNLGQIKAQGVLNARDARDFANAGLAIVPMLAKMYTEQKTFGDEMVTTAQVYDMMSKKMVTYSDVLKVLYKVTDEGGKFFDFQAKQADTLRVQMANLTLAYNNMLNEIGSENQGVLSGMVGGLKTLLKHWRDIQRILFTLITTFGVYKTVSMLAVGAQTISAWISLARSIKSAKDAMALFNLTTSANPLGLLLSVLAGVIGYFVLFKNEVAEVSQEVEMFGESASKTISKVNTLKKVIDGTDDTSNTYKKTLSELSNIAKEYGIELDAEKARRDEINKATEQTIQLIKEESAERQRANQLTKAQENYDAQANSARQSLRDSLKTAMTGTDFGIFTTKSDNKEIQQNADAIADIIGSVVESNIMLIAGKTGDEYEKGLDKMFSIIQTRMKDIGISKSTISKQWLSSTLFSNTNLVNEYIDNIVRAKNEQDNYVEKIEKNYKAAKKATEATMTFTQKVDANARALRNNTNDAVSLYNRIYDIVKIAKENHVINFDLKLSAEKPPKWMLDKSLPELQQLAERFTSIAQSGGHIEGYNRESTYERGLLYASAARIKQEEEERNARKKDHKTKTKQSDEIAKAIKDEISLVKELQGAYDTLTKKGDSHANAIAKVQDLYGKTINLLNKDMDKFGLPKLDLSIIKGNNHNEVLAFFERLRDVLESKGLSNLERMEAVEGVVKEFRLKADTYNLDMITKGLNNELGKLKDEYELAVELDANPEMGNLFADWMGVDMSALSHTAEEYAKRMTKALNKYLADEKSGIEIDDLLALTDDDLRMFQQRVDNGELTQVWVDNIVKNTKEARNALKKENSNIAKEWDSLIQKYAEYEYKIAQVQRNANKERKAFALKYGTNDQKERVLVLTTEIDAEEDQAKKQELINQLKQLLVEIAGDDDSKLKINTAINKKELEDGAKISFEKFQKSPEWIVATGDLAGMTNKAIGGLIGSIESYKKKAKNLDPKQIKNINNALRKLYKQQREGNPFSAISNAIDQAKARMEDIQPALDNVMDDIIKLEEEIGDTKPTEEQAKTLDKLKKKWKELYEVGQISASDIVSGINSAIDVAVKASDSFNKMAEALGGTNMTKAAKTISDITGNLQAAGQGAAAGAQLGGGWGAAIGATAGGLTDLVTRFAEQWSGNKSQTERVKEVEESVGKLELAYIDLEHAVDKAMGTAVIGAKQAALANKQAQLESIKRQLELEKERDSKYRDSEKILSLEKQYKSLFNEIKSGINDISNNMLGISSVSDAAESLVGSMIDAFKRGEDYMEVYSNSFEDMIDNMVMKAVVGKIIGERIEQMFEYVGAISKKRADSQRYGVVNDLGQVVEMSYDEAVNKLTSLINSDSISNELKENYSKQLERINKEYSKNATPSPDDIRESREMWESWKDADKEAFDAWMEAYGIKYGQDATDTKLSALQQGIQGVTEDTAGALEAYMNGVSQQVYLHSDLLTQIRDAVVGIEIDAQIATQAQILLQLQQSYTVQMAIQGILEGWSSPNGMSVRVEMQ